MRGHNTFSEELNKLRKTILAMASRVERDLDKALAVLHGEDAELAREVKADDAVINSLQLKIEDDAASLLAAYGPVARDLRELVTVFKLTANLERMGDYAVHLAKAALKLRSEPSFRFSKRMEKMAQTGSLMLRLTIEAYLEQNAAHAREAAQLDSEIDAEHKALTEEAIGLIKEHPELAKKALRLLQASGFLERFGDHITNMCESVIYMVESSHEELNG
ncbi:MAG: phosphate signaling complex protein PhoU [Spirochaetales bacterium]|jgi:phosphate transport system protein|nr:phosphate signaling complex protein PhoU [Spirochaetales bacterium]